MHLVNMSPHELFHALSDLSRLRIVKLLLTSKSELCLCEFSESLNEPEYKLSRHIKILKEAGLISSVRDGKWIYHSLVKDQKYLRLVHDVIRLFPENEAMIQDFVRFKKRKLFRENGRCRESTIKQCEGRTA